MDFTHISNALEFSKKGTNNIAQVGVDAIMDLDMVDAYLGLKALATIDKSAKTMAMEMSAVTESVEDDDDDDDGEWN